MKRVYGLLVLLLGGSASLQAQDDPFGNVDTHKYQGNMTITAQVIQNGSELTDAVVAVYCDGELREKGSVGNGTNPKRVYLTVHGEYTGHDDYLYFKVYTGGKTFTYDPDPAITFTFNGSIGTDSNPYTIDITPVGLADNADNNNVLTTWAGKTCDVALTDRTLYKDGNWNTICLPFDVDDFTSTIFADAEVKTLGNSDACNTGFDGTTGTLHLEFLQTDEIEAGQPYIVRWTKPEGYDENPDNFDIVNPTFSAVTVRDEDPTDHALISRDGYVQFIGTFSPTGIYTAAKTNLYLSAANKLHYPEAEGFTVNAHRAYFQLLNGLTAGNPNAGVKAFLLDFGDENSEATGIITTNSTNLTNSDGAWYTLDGRRLSGKPAQKGIYLHNSNKIVIK